MTTKEALAQAREILKNPFIMKDLRSALRSAGFPTSERIALDNQADERKPTPEEAVQAAIMLIDEAKIKNPNIDAGFFDARFSKTLMECLGKPQPIKETNNPHAKTHGISTTADILGSAAFRPQSNRIITSNGSVLVGKEAESIIKPKPLNIAAKHPKHKARTNNTSSSS